MARFVDKRILHAYGTVNRRIGDMAKQGAPRRGRPGREPAAGERVKLGLRVTPKVKKQLDQAAADSGRSQSQEAEMRLERSFYEGELLPELMDREFGPAVAGLFALLGRSLTEARYQVASTVSSDNWLIDSLAFAEVAGAFTVLLQALDPDSTGKRDDEAVLTIGGYRLAQTLGRVVGDEGDDAAALIRKRLAPEVLDRLRLYFKSIEPLLRRSQMRAIRVVINRLREDYPDFPKEPDLPKEDFEEGDL